MKTEIEQMQQSRTKSQQMKDLLISQWTFQGGITWLITAVLLIILTTTIQTNYDIQVGFVVWIKWVSFFLIALIAYMFRPRDEGTAILEGLSYYPFIQQMFARFLIIMGMQGIIILPFTFYITGTADIMTYLAATYVPLLFFGVTGFTSTIWLGGKLGSIATATLWTIFIFIDQQIEHMSIFRIAEHETILFSIGTIIGMSGLLLGTYRLKSKKVIE